MFINAKWCAEGMVPWLSWLARGANIVINVNAKVEGSTPSGTTYTSFSFFLQPLVGLYAGEQRKGCLCRRLGFSIAQTGARLWCAGGTTFYSLSQRDKVFIGKYPQGFAGPGAHIMNLRHILIARGYCTAYSFFSTRL
jgi:hypothetical protein